MRLQAAPALAGRARHVAAGLGRRLREWWRAALPIAQAAVAAGLAWLAAVHAAGHPSPFFAPIAAVVCLGVTLGPRLRRGVELVVGVGLGIGAGGLLVATAGTGPWQIALAVAISAAVVLDGGLVITVQAAASAVLVAALSLPGAVPDVGRMVDALIGGAVGLGVAADLPGNPLTGSRRAAARVLAGLARALREVALALGERDATRAAGALDGVRDSRRLVEELRAALRAGQEIAAIAPIRWPCRPELGRYRTLLAPVDQALGDTGVLIRRAVIALRDGEAIPGPVPGALDQLAGAVELLDAEERRCDEAAGLPLDVVAYAAPQE